MQSAPFGGNLDSLENQMVIKHTHCTSPWEVAGLAWIWTLGYMACLSLPLCTAGEVAALSNHGKQQQIPSLPPGVVSDLSNPASTCCGFSLIHGILL